MAAAPLREVCRPELPPCGKKGKYRVPSLHRLRPTLGISGYHLLTATTTCVAWSTENTNMWTWTDMNFFSFISIFPGTNPLNPASQLGIVVGAVPTASPKVGRIDKRAGGTLGWVCLSSWPFWSQDTSGHDLPPRPRPPLSSLQFPTLLLMQPTYIHCAPSRYEAPSLDKYPIMQLLGLWLICLIL